jgi:hypothetical protein
MQPSHAGTGDFRARHEQIQIVTAENYDDALIASAISQEPKFTR